jgi:AP-1 complex subunit gamma-1
MGVGTASGGAAQATQEASPITPSTSTKAAPAGNNIDLLADIFGSGSGSGSQPTPQSPPISSSVGGGSLLDMLGQDATSPKIQQRATSPTAGLQSMASLGQALPGSPSSQNGRDNKHQAFAQDGLVIYLTPSRDQQNSTVINIQITFNNDGSHGTISDMQFQAAVPKTQRLQMAAASSNVIQPGSSEKQMMRVANPQQVSRKGLREVGAL